PSLLLTYSFSWPADHRHLHPFPTRRSSDLELELDPPDGATSIETRLNEQQDSARLTDAVQQLPLIQRQVVVLALEDMDYAEIAQDRKSTRLNSSHVKISYAVFCLKKKTNTD